MLQSSQYNLQMAMAIPAMEMILPQSSGGNIPAFLAKLWKMVNNPEIGTYLNGFYLYYIESGDWALS